MQMSSDDAKTIVREWNEQLVWLCGKRNRRRERIAHREVVESDCRGEMPEGECRSEVPEIDRYAENVEIRDTKSV